MPAESAAVQHLGLPGGKNQLGRSRGSFPAQIPLPWGWQCIHLGSKRGAELEARRDLKVPEGTSEGTEEDPSEAVRSSRYWEGECHSKER